MFGFNDPEELRRQLKQQQMTSEERERVLLTRLEHLTGALGNLYLLAESGAKKFDWENSQTEYHANGFEAGLMRQAQATRTVCVTMREVICKELAALGLEPHQVGEAARAKRHTDEKRARAAALRSEAARLEAEITPLPPSPSDPVDK